MTREEAREVIAQKCLASAAKFLQCPVLIDDSQTEEHSWGWSFTCVPVDPTQCLRDYKRCHFAVDRVTGIFTPIGNKGIPEAVNYLMKWRQKRQEAANQQQAGSRTAIAKSSQAEPGAAPDPAM
jgi:hypothetical protein